MDTGQSRLTSCCKYFWFKGTSLLLTALPSQELQTHPHPKSFPFCKRSHSCADQHTSDGDCWAVGSWLKAPLCLLSVALASELLKIFRTDQYPSPSFRTHPALGRIPTSTPSAVLPVSLFPNPPPAIFPMSAKHFCPQPQLSVPWGQGTYQPFSCHRHQCQRLCHPLVHPKTESPASYSQRHPLSLPTDQGEQFPLPKSWPKGNVLNTKR